MPWILCGPGAPPDRTGEVFRLDRDHAHARLSRLQNLADSGDRAAGADAGDDEVDLAERVVPDFLRGGAAMDLRIGGIFELLRHDRARRRIDDLVRLGDRAFHALRGGGEDQFGPEQGEHLTPLDGHRFGHHQNQPVAASRRHERQRDSSIAGGGLDKNSASWRNLALRLERVDHCDADPVFDARDRIEELELGQKSGDDALLLGDPVHADKGSIADRVGDRRENPSAPWRPPRSASICHLTATPKCSPGTHDPARPDANILCGTKL